MQRTGHGSIWHAAIAAAIAAAPLAACSHVPDAVNPVEWYRDVAGLSKNDSQDLNQRNEKNLQAGADRPYPNLADVPDVPSTATGAIDRDKLKESLVADRENAKYSNEQLQAGRQLASAAPPPPPALSPAPPVAPSPSQNQPGSTGPAPIAPAAQQPAPTAQQPAPTAQQPSPSGAASAPPSAARQAAPMESPLTTPQVRSVPQGETPSPPPPPASVMRTAPPATPSATPAPTAPAAPPAAPQVAATLPPAPASPPASVRQSPTPRDNQPTLAMHTPASAANTISVSVGDITFAPGSHDLSAAHRGTLSEIAGLYKQAGGKIRVVGYAEPQGGADPVKQRVATLNLSIDRANAVAQALTQMGVPASDITVEAAPQRGGQEIPRAEVFMEY